jgi:hypothetical protein
MTEALPAALFALAQANFSAGMDFGFLVRENIAKVNEGEKTKVKVALCSSGFSFLGWFRHGPRCAMRQTMWPVSCCRPSRALSRALTVRKTNNKDKRKIVLFLFFSRTSRLFLPSFCRLLLPFSSSISSSFSVYSFVLLLLLFFNFFFFFLFFMFFSSRSFSCFFFLFFSFPLSVRADGLVQGRTADPEVQGVLDRVHQGHCQPGQSADILPGPGRGHQGNDGKGEHTRWHRENLISTVLFFLFFFLLIKVTNRRVNALDCIVIPRIERTIKCWSSHGLMCCFDRLTALVPPDITSELDEMEREEFYRLKKVRCALHSSPMAC